MVVPRIGPYRPQGQFFEWGVMLLIARVEAVKWKGFQRRKNSEK